MKQIGFLLILPFVLLLSCESVPESSDLEFLLDLIEADELIPLEAPPQAAAILEDYLSGGLTVEDPPVEAPLPETRVFDPDNISSTLYESTKTDIQSLIQTLDGIIRARNYDAWLGYLSDSYRSQISASDFLDERTEELHRRNQIVAAAMGRNPRTVEKKELKTLRDYFDNVVVPSRANDRVDDIAFISETRIRAYMVDNRGTRLILYDLEIIGNNWKITG